MPISAGSSSATFEVSKTTTSGVRIMDDSDAEYYEHLYLKLQRGSDYLISGRDWLRVTIIDDENPPTAPKANGDGTYTVPAEWPLAPEELRKHGGEFRLLFLTNDWRDATSSNIADYDAHVQASVAGSHTGGSHEAIKPYSGSFKVVGSTVTVSARDHIDAGRDAPIYWMNGRRAAVDNEKFWSSSWENWARHDRRTAASVSVGDSNTRNDWHWTGTNADGTRHSDALGSSGNVRRGRFFNTSGDQGPISHNAVARTQNHALLGISPVFRVERRPRLQLESTETGTPFTRRKLGRSGTYSMLVVDEPAACADPANDVSELGGVSHASNLASYRVRLYADPGGHSPMWVMNPKYVTYRQGGLASGPPETWPIIWRKEIGGTNDYRNGLTVRPPGQDTTYAEAGGPPVNTGLFNLYFDSSNWDQWQTINLNIHCADHEDDKAYIVQNWVRLPGDTFSCRDGNQSTNCDHSTWHDVRVNVIDTKSSAEPADLSVDTAYDGVLSAEPFPYPPLRYCILGACAVG